MTKSLQPADLLSWNAELGYGFYPVDPAEWPYDEAYRAKYEAMSDTPMAKRLNFHRVHLATVAAELAEQPTRCNTVLDIGPGDGAFMRAMSKVALEGEDFVFGFDVNPAMVDRMKAEGRYAEPNLLGLEQHQWTVMTFWDSFEHIHRPDKTLVNARSVAMSIPIFDNKEHVLASKHFRPTEHIWYFTDGGIKAFMRKLGFVCIHSDGIENQLGREGINSYVFLREELQKI